ncbi:MAG: DNA methyltransferase [Rhodobacteraceae bacterium]|nr:DNA methyltransferase [Paracoccaceae bacterium]
MAAIDELIAQVEDTALRERLRDEADRITRKKQFGLVFETHLPELIPIYSATIRRYEKVALRDGPLTDLWRVLAMRHRKALCRNVGSGTTRLVPLDELVVVRQFGEPIFPALTPVDRVQNGPDVAPWHTLIEADNYHALQLLEYAYAEKVDCIYIDPPYNSGANDWKFNNNYVDDNDNWKHSKWLAFMQRRLKLAKRLLNPNDSVLIVTIDENEILHLGLLLNEVFPKCKIQLTTLVINPKGTARYNEFSRVEEYAFFIYFGNIRIQSIGSDMLTSREYLSETHVRWRGLARTGRKGLRSNNPGSWYPIFLTDHDYCIHSIGDAIGINEAETDVDVPAGTIAVWPPTKGKSQYSWGTVPKTLRSIHAKGGLKLGKVNPAKGSFPFYYVSAGLFKKIDNGEIVVTGRGRYNELVLEYAKGLKSAAPRSVWNRVSHDAGSHGTGLLKKIFATSAFPFPKSLYAVHDSVRLFTAHKPKALILDFFAGSGTTLNAVNLLNLSDGGQRQCIMVTNNEVSKQEAKSLKKQGFRCGQAEWERHGICRTITWPRSKFTILGKRDDGTPIDGEYIVSNTVEIEKPRKCHQIGFTTARDLETISKRKQLVALIDGIPQSAIKKDSAFVVSDDYSASILFDEAQSDLWLHELSGQDHIVDFYIVTTSNSKFNELKVQIKDLLGPVILTEENKRPIREGFSTNLEYFSLSFLEKDDVALGRQFREILPILWLRAGALGPRPELPKGKSLPAMIIPEKTPFAVLIDETRFADFATKIEARNDLTHVYLVTDSDEAFQEMAGHLMFPYIIQLYRDYLENFVINKEQEDAS